MKKISTVPAVAVEVLIHDLRGEKVILDSDLARIYGVTTARLNQQIVRNLERFPADFMFRVTPQEWGSLMLQNATSKRGRGGRRKLPWAFTEHGAIMAANVLRSKSAVRMSVFVVRAFVKLRKGVLIHKDLAEKLKELEQRVGRHDGEIQAIIGAIRQLMKPPEPSRRRIGF